MHNEINTSKAKDVKSSLLKLFKYCKSFKWLILTAIILSVLASILSIIGPMKLKDITNIISAGLTTKIDYSKVKEIGLVLIILFSSSFIFSYLEGLIMSTVTNKISKKLRNEISHKINILPLSYFDKTSIGDTLSRVTNDTDTIGDTLNQNITTLISSVVLFVGTTIMMFIINWIMAITAILSCLFGFIIMSLILKKSQKYFTKVQQKLGNINGYIEEMFTGYNIVKVYNATEEVNKNFDKINNELYINNQKSQFYSSLMGPLMGFIGNFGYVMVCIVGSILVLNNSITIGVIVAFMIYVRLFSQPLSSIAQSLTSLQSTAAASERVFEFLEAEEMNSETNLTEYIDKNKVKGNIEFKNVKFGYNKKNLVIKNFNASVHSGQKIAIVGPTGAGKTTIVNLLMKFYEMNSGDILIDNVSLKNLTRKNIHDLFIMVLQDTWLFEGTIKDNIKYNNPNISDEKIIETCKMVGLDYYIRTLPEGYNTYLNDQSDLSDGQKQLLTIARGMLKNAPFLILDEATSNVDTRTEELVTSSINKLSHGRTSFIIAHRLSTIKNADLILVMNNNSVVEIGNHQELLNKNGFYAKLYNSQFQNIN